MTCGYGKNVFIVSDLGAMLTGCNAAEAIRHLPTENLTLNVPSAVTT